MAAVTLKFQELIRTMMLTLDIDALISRLFSWFLNADEEGKHIIK